MKWAPGWPRTHGVTFAGSVCFVAPDGLGGGAGDGPGVVAALDGQGGLRDVDGDDGVGMDATGGDWATSPALLAPIRDPMSFV
jgi:hypothetical protein